MNIAPMPLPAAAPTHEAPRPVQPPTHESSRPIIAPNPSEAMAHETRHDDAQRTARLAERKIEQDPQAHSQHPRRREARGSVAADSPTTEARPKDPAVGALLDVFA